MLCHNTGSCNDTCVPGQYCIKMLHRNAVYEVTMCDIHFSFNLEKKLLITHKQENLDKENLQNESFCLYCTA